MSWVYYGKRINYISNFFKNLIPMSKEMKIIHSKNPSKYFPSFIKDSVMNIKENLLY